MELPGTLQSQRDTSWKRLVWLGIDFNWRYNRLPICLLSLCYEIPLGLGWGRGGFEVDSEEWRVISAKQIIKAVMHCTCTYGPNIWLRVQVCFMSIILTFPAFRLIPTKAHILQLWFRNTRIYKSNSLALSGLPLGGLWTYLLPWTCLYTFVSRFFKFLTLLIRLLGNLHAGAVYHYRLHSLNTSNIFQKNKTQLAIHKSPTLTPRLLLIRLST